MAVCLSLKMQRPPQYFFVFLMKLCIFVKENNILI